MSFTGRCRGARDSPNRSNIRSLFVKNCPRSARYVCPVCRARRQLAGRQTSPASAATGLSKNNRPPREGRKTVLVCVHRGAPPPPGHALPLLGLVAIAQPRCCLAHHLCCLQERWRPSQKAANSHLLQVASPLRASSLPGARWFNFCTQPSEKNGAVGCFEAGTVSLLSVCVVDFFPMPYGGSSALF